jgi:hypothetical protein
MVLEITTGKKDAFSDPMMDGTGHRAYRMGNARIKLGPIYGETIRKSRGMTVARMIVDRVINRFPAHGRPG